MGGKKMYVPGPNALQRGFLRHSSDVPKVFLTAVNFHGAQRSESIASFSCPACLKKRTVALLDDLDGRSSAMTPHFLPCIFFAFDSNAIRQALACRRQTARLPLHG